jgi:predicted Zn-dependent protease
MPNSTQYTLDDFAETLIKAKQYKTLTQEIHDALKKDILSRVHDFLLAKTIAKLNDEQAKSLSDLLDTNPSDEIIQDFIAKSIPEAPDFVGNILFEFRQIYLGLA